MKLNQLSACGLIVFPIFLTILALALAAKDVRLRHPFQVDLWSELKLPNSEIATVTFRELWEQSKTDDKKLLEVPLGEKPSMDLFGRLIWQKCLTC